MAADNTFTSVEAQLQSEVAALAHKHVTITWGLLGILGVVLALGGVGAWVAVKFADAQLARAERTEAAYQLSLKSFQETLAAHDAQRAAIDGQKKVVVQVVHDRDTQANTAIATAMTPNAPAAAVAAGLGAVEADVPGFGTPKVTTEGTIALEPSQAQQLTAQKIDRDRLAGNLADETKLYNLESVKSTSLSTDLTGCKTELAESAKVTAAYKKAAKSSKFRKVLRGFGEGVAIAGAFYLGHKL